MLSGVGEADALRRLDLPVIADLAGVGANLQDHIEIYVQHACTQPVSLYSTQKPLAKLAVGLRWLLTSTGPGASNHFEAGGFIRSRAGVRHPDLQYTSGRSRADYDGKEKIDQHGFRHTWVRCGRPARALCGCDHRIRASTRRSSSTTCRPKAIEPRCAPPSV